MNNIIKPYNPLDKKNIGMNIAEAALRTQVCSLPPKPFAGAGVYIIYYTGDFPAYKKISDNNMNNKFKSPIYIGKAVPVGARKGGSIDEVYNGSALYNRLCEHAASINAAVNLDLKDFFCRFLVVDDIWIPLAETLLIEIFQPVWNIILEGFGNHDPGKGRYSGKMPLWDCLHAGREWAKKMKPCAYTPEQLIEIIQNFNLKPVI